MPLDEYLTNRTVLEMAAAEERDRGDQKHEHR